MHLLRTASASSLSAPSCTDRFPGENPEACGDAGELKSLGHFVGVFGGFLFCFSSNLKVADSIRGCITTFHKFSEE